MDAGIPSIVEKNFRDRRMLSKTLGFIFFVRKTTDWRSNRALQISAVALSKFQLRAVLLNLSISVSYQSFYPIGLER